MTQYAFPLSRTSDPATSKAAGEAARQLRAEHHGKILAALDTPMTYRELALKTGLDPVQVGRRMGELLPPKKCPACRANIALLVNRVDWYCVRCPAIGTAKVRVVGERKLSTGRAGRVFARTDG